MSEYKNPAVAADIVCLRKMSGTKKVLLVERKRAPHGWALPGGFVDEGESTETAAYREIEEETGLYVHDLRLVGVWSEPDRDPRSHVISIAYVADGFNGELKTNDEDEVSQLKYFDIFDLPQLAFPDHEEIIEAAADMEIYNEG